MSKRRRVALQSLCGQNQPSPCRSFIAHQVQRFIHVFHVYLSLSLSLSPTYYSLYVYTRVSSFTRFAILSRIHSPPSLILVSSSLRVFLLLTIWSVHDQDLSFCPPVTTRTPYVLVRRARETFANVRDYSSIILYYYVLRTAFRGNCSGRNWKRTQEIRERPSATW